MRAKKAIGLVAVVLTLVMGMNLNVVYADSGDEKLNSESQEWYAEMTDDEVLEYIGMDKEQIENIDSDVKAFIIADLKESNQLLDCQWINSESQIMITPRSNVLNGIEFSVIAFRVTDGVYIYPTYEFTDEKKPAGNDSFSFYFGDAILPYEYGGVLWYMDEFRMDSWERVDTLVANNQSLSGAEYSGSQLGTPDTTLRFKGCASVKARNGSGTDKRMVVSYLYNPKSLSYSISVSLGSIFSISYNTPAGVSYSASKTFELSY